MQDEKAAHRYDDILTLPHPVSLRHPQMAMEQRAAQFSPFAALTGYSESIAETARVTEARMELDDTEKAAIDEKLRLLKSALAAHPRESAAGVCITYFLPDAKKAGGAYVRTDSPVKKMDEYTRTLLLADETRIPIDDISGLDGPFFRILADLPG